MHQVKWEWRASPSVIPSHMWVVAKRWQIKSWMARFLLSSFFRRIIIKTVVWSVQIYSNIRCGISCIAELYRRQLDPGDRGSALRVLAVALKTSSSWCCCSCNIVGNRQQATPNSNLCNGFDWWQFHWLIQTDNFCTVYLQVGSGPKHNYNLQ